MCQNKSAEIYSEKSPTVCNAVYFRLCINLMHILPTVTAEGFDGYHHPRFAEFWHAGHKINSSQLDTSDHRPARWRSGERV